MNARRTLVLLTLLVVGSCGGAADDTSPTSSSDTPTSATVPTAAPQPAAPSTSPAPTTRPEPDRTTPLPRPPAGVPLEAIVEPYEARFLEESDGYYRSYRLDPCFEGAVVGEVVGGESLDREPLDPATTVSRGTVVECVLATDPPGDSGEIWIIVLDDLGTVATWGGGTGEESGLVRNARPGLLCREFLAQSALTSYWSDEGFPARSTWAYAAVLAYWFIEGEPDRMDVDGDGVPCELLFDPEVVADVWDGDD